MLILSIDTSGRHGSVALCRGDNNSFESLQLELLEGGRYSACLIPTIADVVQNNKLSINDLDGFAVVSGPGSFTGLRVGLATVKGLCEILRKPLVAVSMLEAVARIRGSGQNLMTVILDAGRGEIYVGDCHATSAAATPVREYIAKLSEFPGFNDVVGELLTPDRSVADTLLPKSLKVRLVSPVRADEIGRIGIRKLLAGDIADHTSVDVNYIRRSDAEIFSAPKR